MSVTVNLTPQQITQLRKLTRASDDAEAVRQAVPEFLRLAHLRELKSLSGKVDFEGRSGELESLELSETPFP